MNENGEPTLMIDVDTLARKAALISPAEQLGWTPRTA